MLGSLAWLAIAGVVELATLPVKMIEEAAKTLEKGFPIDTPNVIGMDVNEAEKVLKKMGLQVAKVVPEPKKIYAKKQVNEIVEFSPARVRKGEMVKLTYISQKCCDASTKKWF